MKTLCGRVTLIFTIALVVTVATGVSAQELSVVRDVEIPMSDGVTLAADIYSQSPDGRFPTVLVRTPYDKGAFNWLGEALARHGGYAVVIQDVRGQVSSEGEFQPFADELADGVATLDWVAAQPWCDGNIGMWGSSYLAYCGLVLAGSGHPALKTVVNISGWGDPMTMGSPGGTMHLMTALPWSLTGQISGDTERPDYEEIFPLVPVSRMTELAGIDSPIWASYFEEDTSLAVAPSLAGKYGDVGIPILHVTGWSDFLSESTLEVYEKVRAAHEPDGGGPFQKLVVGPWAHDQQWSDESVVGDEDFGPESTMGGYKIIELSIRWFHKFLRGYDTGVNQEPAANLFVMGANEWRYFSEWPPAESEYVSWWLESGGSANTAGGDGALLASDAATPGYDTFVFDPMDPVPTHGGANFHFFPERLGVRDQSEIEGRGDVLVYTSAPLESDTEIIGPVEAVIHASTEGKSTDFTAKLVCVRPDGYARIVTEGIKRDPDHAEDDPDAPMIPGKVYRFTIDMGSTAIRVPAGHRLRLEVSSSNFPKYSRNPNTGEGAELAAEFQTVTQTVYHGNEFASAVRLPVLR